VVTRAAPAGPTRDASRGAHRARSKRSGRPAPPQRCAASGSAVTAEVALPGV